MPPQFFRVRIALMAREEIRAHAHHAAGLYGLLSRAAGRASEPQATVWDRRTVSGNTG